MKVIAIHANENFQEPIKYTFDLIFSILGIEYEILPYSEVNNSDIDNNVLFITYGSTKFNLNVNKRIHIYQSGLFSEDYKNISSMPRLPLKHWDDLPIIYEGVGDIRELVVRSDGVLETNIDIIASSFFMLSRYEEIVANEIDQHDRFPATASIAYKEGFLTRPIVNEYIGLLWKWIDSFQLGFRRRAFWKGNDYAVLNTYDIDKVKKFIYRGRPPYRIISDFMKQGQAYKALYSAFDWLISSFLNIRNDPFWTFNRIIKLSNELDISSSFYFMAGGNTKYDSDYSINDPKIIELINKLENEGHEVGLHGSFNSYNDYKMLMYEKSKLDKVVSSEFYGGRQHYLRWKAPHTWCIWEKAGMFYDATLCYADYVGFRCGFCFPFKPFDILTNQVINIWEMPLSIMDNVFINRKLSFGEMLEEIETFIASIRKHNGLLVALWHNNHLSNAYSPISSYLHSYFLNLAGSKIISSKTILSEMATNY